jgi:hypothetical protein
MRQTARVQGGAPGATAHSGQSLLLTRAERKAIGQKIWQIVQRTAELGEAVMTRVVSKPLSTGMADLHMPNWPVYLRTAVRPAIFVKGEP